MWSTAFWRAVAERAASSFAWTLVSVLSADGLDLLNAPWTSVLASAGMAAVLSAAKSVAVNKFSGTGPSLGPEIVEPVAERRGRHERPDA